MSELRKDEPENSLVDLARRVEAETRTRPGSSLRS